MSGERESGPMAGDPVPEHDPPVQALGARTPGDLDSATAPMGRTVDFGDSRFGTVRWCSDMEWAVLGDPEMEWEATGIINCPAEGVLTLDVELPTLDASSRLVDLPVDGLHIGDRAVPASRALSDGRLDDAEHDDLLVRESEELAVLYDAVSRMVGARSVGLSCYIGEPALSGILELPRLEHLAVEFGDPELLLEAGVSYSTSLRWLRAPVLNRELVHSLSRLPLEYLSGGKCEPGFALGFVPGALQGLMRLVLTLDTPLTGPDWEGIGHLHRLEELWLYSSRAAERDGSAFTASGASLATLESLRHLSYVPRVSRSASAMAMAEMSKLPRLRSLHIAPDRGAFGYALSVNARPFPGLEEIIVWGPMDPEDVAAIAHPPLTSFHYHGRTPIGAAGWSLLANTPTLVDCYTACEVDSASIAAIARSESIRSLSLKVSESEQVGVGRLGDSRTIEHLDLWWQHAGIDEFSAMLACGSLRTLRLRGGFGAEHLAVVASSPNLVSLTFLADVADEDKRRFEARRPDVEVTWLR